MRERRGWDIIAGGVFVLWVAGVVTTFYLVQEQRPLSPEQIHHGWRLLRGIGGASLIAGGSLSMGVGGLRLLHWRGLSPLHHLLLAATLGLGMLSVAMLAVGMAGGANMWGAWGILLAAWSVAPRRMLALAREAGRQLHRCWMSWPWSVRGYILLTLGMAFLAALLPPTDWDGLFYHLTGPKLSLAEGRIGWLNRHTPQFNFPWLGESLYLLGMALSGDVTPKLLHWWSGLLITGWIVDFAHRHLGHRGSVWAVLLFTGMPMVSTLASWAYTDLFLTLFVVAETALLAEATMDRATGGHATFFLAGLMGGLATGVKYTAVLWPLIGGAMALSYNTSVYRRPAHRTWLFALGVILGGLPWPLKNLMLTGNPVYPFLFHGREWDAFRAAWYAGGGKGIWGEWVQIALLPLILTLGLRDMNFYDGRTGPLWLVLLPLVISWGIRLIRQRRSEVEGWWAWCIIATLGGAHAAGWAWGVLWSAGLYQSRLLLPALAVYTWPATAALLAMRRWRIGPFSPYAFLKLLTAIVLGGNLLYQARDLATVKPWAYWLGLESREAYLARTITPHWEAMTMLHELPSDTRVLFLWEPRSYYAPSNVEPDAILDRWAHLYHLYGTPARVADALRAEGFTHILLHDEGMMLIRERRVKELAAPPPVWEALDEFLTTQLTPVRRTTNYTLYTWYAPIVRYPPAGEAWP